MKPADQRAEAAVTGLNLAVTLCLAAIGEQLDPQWLIGALNLKRQALDTSQPEQQIAENLIGTAIAYLHATTGAAGVAVARH